jgi:hypothetical protein
MIEILLAERAVVPAAGPRTRLSGQEFSRIMGSPVVLSVPNTQA